MIDHSIASEDRQKKKHNRSRDTPEFNYVTSNISLIDYLPHPFTNSIYTFPTILVLPFRFLPSSLAVACICNVLGSDANASASNRKHGIGDSKNTQREMMTCKNINSEAKIIRYQRSALSQNNSATRPSSLHITVRIECTPSISYNRTLKPDSSTLLHLSFEKNLQVASNPCERTSP